MGVELGSGKGANFSASVKWHLYEPFYVLRSQHTAVSKRVVVSKKISATCLFVLPVLKNENTFFPLLVLDYCICLFVSLLWCFRQPVTCVESKTKKELQKEFDRALSIEVAAVNPFHLGNMKKGAGWKEVADKLTDHLGQPVTERRVQERSGEDRQHVKSVQKERHYPKSKVSVICFLVNIQDYVIYILIVYLNCDQNIYKTSCKVSNCTYYL